MQMRTDLDGRKSRQGGEVSLCSGRLDRIAQRMIRRRIERCGIVQLTAFGGVDLVAIGRRRRTRRSPLIRSEIRIVGHVTALHDL